MSELNNVKVKSIHPNLVLSRVRALLEITPEVFEREAGLLKRFNVWSPAEPVSQQQSPILPSDSGPQVKKAIIAEWQSREHFCCITHLTFSCIYLVRLTAVS